MSFFIFCENLQKEIQNSIYNESYKGILNECYLIKLMNLKKYLYMIKYIII